MVKGEVIDKRMKEREVFLKQKNSSTLNEPS